MYLMTLLVTSIILRQIMKKKMVRNMEILIAAIRIYIVSQMSRMAGIKKI